jgi:cell pole-organizing protein PopZ
MKQGQKAAEPRMEDVLASIRRAIDENANGPSHDRVGGSMAEFRVKFDTPANQEARTRRSQEQPAPGASLAQGFAGILSGKRATREVSPPRDSLKPREPVQRQLDPIASSKNVEGQRVYDGYYGAQVENYSEALPVPEVRPAPASLNSNPTRYLPLPPPTTGGHRQNLPHTEGQRQSFPKTAALMSEASSDATQAAFTRLAETLTRRALGDRPMADLPQEMLRGMLKQWLDENLPKIVERLVREEIERVVRRPR